MEGGGGGGPNIIYGVGWGNSLMWRSEGHPLVALESYLNVKVEVEGVSGVYW